MVSHYDLELEGILSLTKVIEQQRLKYIKDTTVEGHPYSQPIWWESTRGEVGGNQR